MKASQLTLAVLLTAAFGSAAHAANVEGGSSNPNLIKPKISDTIPFGWGAAGIQVSSNGHLSNSINLEVGPAQRIRNKYGNAPINGGNQNANVNGTANPRYLTPGDVNPVLGWFSSKKLGQVWYEKRANNTEVFSVRQMAELSEAGLLKKAPKFGGMTFAKVPTAATNVFFGEWAPRKGNSNQIANSTDLNMNDSNRTVWFVGENPTKNTTGLATATYNVVGINKHTPGKNDFYTGEIKATFGTGDKGSMSGALKRAGDKDLSFNGVEITNSAGTFKSGAGNHEKIQGQFYGKGAAAMAGYAERGNGKGDDVAFGGAKK
ncbi:hypothetical protein NELON_07070 [Neisseria elongata subsp. glycolytica ATCC 29315]|jgi:hypothetical protein|uniref:Transferrin-binding protein B C-lobe/N-lobe beta barrel domain-containing protein n=1 Tax=Neisseria elongata subsp. glycolytica ATCC 29315 TaxID=546263 RepID=D4DQ18_NEIEG|nr:Slam-dependent surface lipoprotein [Neisseria elongata]AJE18671.1 hypothetical protein NELON_07070 [Neisseria elongata subsp. glycolytica ATCC 29315]EFE50123.1 hypothetical protein NEIELOOT_01156 [Neisseria elongata subsp. glycolytica ATCC 29315]SQH50558.1 Uncharacterised protein [Neisseria elongata subsp. glycolytica]